MTKLTRILAAIVLWAAVAVAHAGTHHYYYTDPQGTVLAKADASGTIVATYDYAPYGTAVASLSPAPNGPGYTGHVNDPDTGLVYMQARYYDPAVGRFLSVDPVEPSEGDPFKFNRFAYVNNNPIVNTDPDGTTCTKSESSKLYECHVDKNDGKKFNDQQIKDTNKAYTDAVNTLNSHPNATVVVTVQGVSFKANAGDVARALVSAIVVTSSESSTGRASTLGGGLAATSNYRLNYQPLTTIFKNAITTDRSGGTSNIIPDLARTFVHEGIHMLPRENKLYDIYRTNPARFEIIHRDPYNKAGNTLYDGGK
ncbi:RHS repeat-associated core domain-containing protein [Rhodanobacter sp. OK091]|uniref:RHS repeat-associated core domain-containing protein n=1 Tax=Rhodanobacter sp. OK091 TaxID=1881037 RepID=UPI00090F7CD8|nr:RHS repeat-associated core domain-containing protein [Rhodanobacter sp. OK091]SHM47967.1 RHS repeat-associated core domain-containing protein [Rhodanobacter sp. OK091]